MSDWYCPLPFKHVFVDSTGLSPCCNTIGSFGLQINIEQYKSHPKLVSLQQQFLAGEKPAECSYCARQENIQNKSMRLDALRNYNNEIFTDTQFDFIHYSQSNICNFKCRSCGPLYSHSITNEFKNNPNWSNFKFDEFENIALLSNKKDPNKQLVSVPVANQQWIIDNIKYIRRLMITGGEPTVMPEVRKLFEHLKSNPQDQLQIMMTTNGSWTDDFWYDLIQSFPGLHITLSIDGVGSVAELVRHGTVWPKVEYNLKWLAKNANSLDINTVVSRLNILHLYSILELCCEARISSIYTNGGKHGDLGLRHQFSICMNPSYMTITNFPDSDKLVIIEQLTRCLELDLDAEQITVVNGLISTINESKHNKEQWIEAERYHNEFDRIRNEDHTKLYLI
jgi:pyruvate-formate lyase-activating enzyme